MKRHRIATLGALAAFSLVLGLAVPAAATRASTVSLAASRGTILAGTAVVFSGRIGPGGSRTFELEQFARNKWSSVAQGRSRSTGAYSIRWVDTRAGYTPYRVLALGTRTAAAAASGKVTVLARRWHYLSDWDTVDGNCDAEECDSGMVEIDGTNYLHSIFDEGLYTDGNDEHDYNLARQCVTFKATFGTDDVDTDPDGTAQVAVGVDGNALFTQQFGLGQSTAVTENIAGHLRINLTAVSTNENAQVSVGWGNAAVLCNF